MEEKKSFGAYIRRKRQELGLTQRQLADALYVAESTVSKWERGLSYPDVSLIPEVCRALCISEHEFFTACDDDKAAAQARAAAVWKRLVTVWWWFCAVGYAVALAVCFICDLAISRRLDWFWIVLTSLMLAFSLTNLPLLLHRRRWPICLGAATGSLILLLLSCWLYTGGTWVLGGLAITAVCLLLPWGAWALWRFYGRRLPAVLTAWATVWTFLLLPVIWLFAPGDWLWKLALPIAGYCWAAAWVYFAILCLPPLNGWLKAGLCTLLTALLMPASTAFADLLTAGRVQPKAEVYFQFGRLLHPAGLEWINPLVFLCLLALAAALLAVGTFKKAREATP